MISCDRLTELMPHYIRDWASAWYRIYALGPDTTQSCCLYCRWNSSLYLMGNNSLLHFQPLAGGKWKVIVRWCCEAWLNVMHCRQLSEWEHHPGLPAWRWRGWCCRRTNEVTAQTGKIGTTARTPRPWYGSPLLICWPSWSTGSQSKVWKQSETELWASCTDESTFFWMNNRNSDVK